MELELQQVGSKIAVGTDGARIVKTTNGYKAKHPVKGSATLPTIAAAEAWLKG